MRAARAALAFLLLACAAPLRGQTTSGGPTGSTMLRSCNDAVRLDDGQAASMTSSEMTEAVYCAAYLSGFLDALALVQWKGGTTKVCLPSDGVENSQAARIYVKYLQAHPTELNQSGRILFINAIGEAFKC